ncbi:MAG TPA: hypothetical protein VM557_09505 [Thermoanaerobaculia bacterium]|nr:hypothetical protein [Thermoanaerobaculia bacterium]
MKKRILCTMILTVALAAGCVGRDEGVVTEQISPATPPAAESGDDAVMTQTTEIGDERSPNEGGVLADPGASTEGLQPAPTRTTTTTAGSPPPQP